MSEGGNIEKWKAISLTMVEYPEGDLVGMLLAYSSLLPILIGWSFLTLIYFRREMHTVSYFAGLVASEVANFIIKHFVKEPRPNFRSLNQIGVKYGWPSSHAQFIWFFVVYLNCFVYVRCNDARSRPLVHNLWKCLMSLSSLFVAMAVSYSRVYLAYHTQNQVMWGGLIGSVLALVWFAAVHFVLTPFFPIFVHSKFGEFFMIRDSTVIPNVLWFEYSISRQESRNRSRKLSISKSQ